MLKYQPLTEIPEHLRARLEAIHESTREAKRLYAAHDMRMTISVDGRRAQLDPVTDEIFFIDETEKETDASQ